MRNSMKTLAVIFAVIAALATAPVLYAYDSQGAGGSMMGQGGMMGQMSQMMEGCKKMMQSMNQDSSGRPNEQWRALER